MTCVEWLRRPWIGAASTTDAVRGANEANEDGGMSLPGARRVLDGMTGTAVVTCLQRSLPPHTSIRQPWRLPVCRLQYSTAMPVTDYPRQACLPRFLPDGLTAQLTDQAA